MSLVEYLGLKYIFSDSFDNDVNKMISGLVSSIGLIGWIIMIFVKPTLLDKGAAVFNLLIAIILLILLIVRLFKEKVSVKSFGDFSVKSLKNVRGLIFQSFYIASFLANLLLGIDIVYLLSNIE